MKNMSKDARAVLDTMIEITGKAPNEGVFCLIQITYEFYAKTVSAAIKRYYNPDSEKDVHAIEFYEKPIRSINKGRRSKEPWGVMTEEKKEIITAVGNFVPSDWGHNESKLLKEICDTATIQEVRDSIKEAQDGQVFNISYLKAIIDSKIGLREMIKESRRRIAEDNKKKLADAIVDVVQRSPIDIAVLMDDWYNTIDGIETEKKLKKVWEDQHNENNRS